MKKYKLYRTGAMLLFLVTMLMSSFSSNGQGVSVSAKIDSSVIFIGGQIDLKLAVSAPAGVDVTFPLYTDTIVDGVEVVRASLLDTLVTDDGMLHLEKTYRITSFDSGLFYIPPIEFELKANDLKEKAISEPLSIMVVNPFDNVDPEKGVVDIKQPLQTPFLLSELYKYIPYVLGLTLLGVLVAIVIVFFTKKKNPLHTFKRVKPKLPPHIVALSKLDKIKLEKLWQHGRVKEYYSEVTDTLRHYVEERYQIGAMEQTTDEIMDGFNALGLKQADSIDKLKQVLSMADLVKFAKFEPLPDENDLALNNAFLFVEQTKVEVVIEKEEADEILIETSELSEEIRQDQPTKN